MRRLFLAASLALLAAGCATAPPSAPPAKPAPAPEPSETGDLVGLDANSLATRFGTPALQVREGEGTKLQWRGRSCVLDTYLYPAVTGSVPRVTHVDARRPSDGVDVDKAGCIAAIAAGG